MTTQEILQGVHDWTNGKIVYDISVAHPDGQGNPTKYATLAAALGTNGVNIPQNLRKGGMSVKFVQSSDNKYVRYNLLADSFTTDTTQWAIDDAGIYVDNPEFIKVYTDKDGRILWAIKADADIYYGAGVPQQVKDYIQSKISELSLDEYEDIVAFLNGLEEGDKTLQELLNEKVDKEDGKSLIDAEYASSKSTIENPEFIEAKTDSEGKFLAGRTTDGAAFENIGFSTPKISIEGNTVSNISDFEERTEIKIDGEEKIVSYRDKEGVLHEESGVTTKYISLSKEGQKKLQEDLKSIPVDKKWYLPKFGTVNIKEETFYLDAVEGFNSKNDVICIQMLDNNLNNAQKRLIVAQYYLKNTLVPLPSGGYDKTSVTNESISLELHAGKDVISIGDKFFATAIYTPVMNGTSIIDYTKNKAIKVTDPVSGEVIGYEYDGRSTEVKQVKDVPPYMAWKVYKQIEHFCVADIDFGTYYKKNNIPVSIKYQGSATTAVPKRSFRITFYKNNDYAKKNKVKIGEMVRLSGYNMKSYYWDKTRIVDPILQIILREVWETRLPDCYPWNKDSVVFNGATGFIKSFPIETYIGDEFYGLQFFGLKKDERNYMLDGDDDSSGIFVSGIGDSWINGNHLSFEDEMMDEMSQETADAIDELFVYLKGFINGSINIEGQDVPFTHEMLEEHIDISSWIDYFIGLQIFMLWDNIEHNMILHTRSDKKKFYAFFYDTDNMAINIESDIIVYCNSPAVREMDTSLWEKLVEEYKDSIINRYFELRKSVFNINNIKSIYYNYICELPNTTIEKDSNRWGDTDVKAFNDIIATLEKRLIWLDNNYFNL